MIHGYAKAQFTAQVAAGLLGVDEKHLTARFEHCPDEVVERYGHLVAWLQTFAAGYVLTVDQPPEEPLLTTYRRFLDFMRETAGIGMPLLAHGAPQFHAVAQAGRSAPSDPLLRNLVSTGFDSHTLEAALLPSRRGMVDRVRATMPEPGETVGSPRQKAANIKALVERIKVIPHLEYLVRYVTPAAVEEVLHTVDQVTVADGHVRPVIFGGVVHAESVNGDSPPEQVSNVDQVEIASLTNLPRTVAEAMHGTGMVQGVRPEGVLVKRVTLANSWALAEGEYAVGSGRRAILRRFEALLVLPLSAYDSPITHDSESPDARPVPCSPSGSVPTGPSTTPHPGAGSLATAPVSSTHESGTGTRPASA